MNFVYASSSQKLWTPSVEKRSAAARTTIPARSPSAERLAAGELGVALLLEGAGPLGEVV